MSNIRGQQLLNLFLILGVIVVVFASGPDVRYHAQEGGGD